MRLTRDRASRLIRARRLVAAALVLTACSGGGDAPSSPEPPAGDELVAQVASYEPLVGEDNRLIVGLLTNDNRYVSGGTVTFRLAYLGEEGGSPEPFAEHEATFLQIVEPGAVSPPPVPTAGPQAQVGRGVYSAEPVAFDRDGTWQVEVVAEVGGKERTATAAFPVLAEPIVPAPGEAAPRTENLTLESSDAPRGAIDSRAEASGVVPDPELHTATIADALERGRPVLAVFATPVYCVSQFCGPITDMILDLNRQYGDRAEFVHVEIWRNHQEQVVNKAAAEWVLAPEGDNITEPWVFLIGGDGKIVARWDNVATPGEIVPLLEALPKRS